MIAFLLFAITFIIYLFSNNGHNTPYNYFVLLADAFAHGKIYLSDNPPWLNELINWQGKYYVVYPPMPAILLMPFVALFGKGFSQSLFSIFLGSINVALAYFVFAKLFKTKIAVWMSALFAFGTMHWFHAEVGSAWYLAHIVAIFFLWLALLEAISKKRFFLIGLLVGFAYLARLPALLAVVFFLFFLKEEFAYYKNSKLTIKIKPLALLFLGILPAFVFNAFYNYVRYGVFYDIGYSLLPIYHEPWYRYGLINLKYILIHLKEICTALPIIKSTPPYIIPSLNVMALWIVTPALLLIVFANFRSKLVFSSLIAVIFMSIPGLVHGQNGFTQFGFRFALDYFPFLLLLIASGLRNQVRWWSGLLIILSIVINLWGIVMISFFE